MIVPRMAHLRHYRALSARIVSLHGELIRGGEMVGSGAVIRRVRMTSTGMVVVTVGPPAGPTPAAVVKLPCSPAAARALDRENAVLRELRARASLVRWAELLPRPLAGGVLEGQPYRLEAALGERTIEELARQGAIRSSLPAAARTIGQLHSLTAHPARVDEELVAAWVDRPLHTLSLRGMDGGLRRRLKRLGIELREALLGRELSVGWIHGDFWPGNLIASDSGTLQGIIDWEAAGDRELALHDLLHLILYTRRLRTGRELGKIVRAQIEQPEWTDEERAVLADGHGVGGVSVRHALLLYWLRHAAVHSAQQPHRSTYRYRLWERRNVSAVAAR